MPHYLVSLTILLGSCQAQTSPPKRVINIQQEWEVKIGDFIADSLVVGGLGDISIQLQRQPLRAPFPGKVEPSTIDQCVIYSTPEVPAYLFRFCGLKRPRLGNIRAGQPIGAGGYIQFATMRRQPDGTWIIVEPSTGILKRAITGGEETPSEDITDNNSQAMNNSDS
ncbi:MAG: hypothetical protein AAF821_21180 [Cyanobacteria bacterium P01_D01_bin.156]